MQFLSTLVLGAVLVLVVVAGWALFSRFKPIGARRCDGWAGEEAGCGSRMELGLELADSRVVRTVCRAEGCGYNGICLHAAGRLARGKTPAELIEIRAEDIRRAVGDLPQDHLHCAEAAARTLRAAARACLAEDRPGPLRAMRAVSGRPPGVDTR